jgi:hypothetical protein
VQCTGIFAGNKPNTTVGVDEPHLSDKNGWYGLSYFRWVASLRLSRLPKQCSLRTVGWHEIFSIGLSNLRNPFALLQGGSSSSLRLSVRWLTLMSSITRSLLRSLSLYTLLWWSDFKSHKPIQSSKFYLSLAG